MRAKSPQLRKKRPEKFKVLKRSAGQSLFFASLINWKHVNNSRPLLISIPKVAGSAVLRNRLKRLIKEWFYSEGLKTIPGQSIWIRYNRTKLLKTPLHYKDWAEMLNQEVYKLKNFTAA